MTPPATSGSENGSDDVDLGVLETTGGIDTTRIGIVDGATAQVDVTLPTATADDDLDDDVVLDDDATFAADAVVDADLVTVTETAAPASATAVAAASAGSAGAAHRPVPGASAPAPGFARAPS